MRRVLPRLFALGLLLSALPLLAACSGERAGADATYDDATGRGTAWAEYDPARVTPERMAEAIGALGYTATPVATDEPG